MYLTVLIFSLLFVADALEININISECVSNLETVIVEMGYVSVHDRVKLAALFHNCGKFSECAHTLETIRGSRMLVPIRSISLYCDAVKFLADGFQVCHHFLVRKSSKCYSNFDRYLDDERIRDNNLKLEIRSEECKALFGENNCVEKEISGFCGPDQWTQFRKHYLTVHNFRSVCNMKF